jgi:hypothetical protein
MLNLLLWLQFLDDSFFSRELKKSFLKVKYFFINVVLLFFIFLVFFSDNSIFFAFCDNECKLVTLVDPLKFDNLLVKEVVVNPDSVLLEKVNNLSEKLKECQKTKNELETQAKINGTLGVVLACLFLFMLGFDLYHTKTNFYSGQ